MSEKNIATMTSAELASHIEDLDAKHRIRINALRALQRARAAEEAMEDDDADH